jgi:hypothetical protein
MREKDSVFKALIGRKVKVKYSDAGDIRSIMGTVADANNFYLVLERPERGDPMLINHSVISRIIPIHSFEEPDDGHHIIDDRKNRGNYK